MNNDDLPDNFGWNEYEYDKWPVAVDEPENDEYIPDLSSIIGGNDDLDEAFQELHIWDDDDDHNAVDVGFDEITKPLIQDDSTTEIINMIQSIYYHNIDINEKINTIITRIDDIEETLSDLASSSKYIADNLEYSEC